MGGAAGFCFGVRVEAGGLMRRLTRLVAHTCETQILGYVSVRGYALGNQRRHRRKAGKCAGARYAGLPARTAN